MKAFALNSGGGVTVEVVVTPLDPISTLMFAPSHSIERLVPPSMPPPLWHESNVDIGPKLPGTKIGVTVEIGTSSEANAADWTSKNETSRISVRA